MKMKTVRTFMPAMLMFRKMFNGNERFSIYM